MGLHTTFVGHVSIEPALSVLEAEMLRDFARTRHCDHPDGPWRLAAHPSDNDCSDTDSDACHDVPHDCNRTADGVPELWCPWTVCRDRTCLHWDGREKPYAAEAWLRYLIDSFLRPGAASAGTPFASAHGLTCDHVLDGMVVGERHETLELFALEVNENKVSRRLLLPGVPGVDEWGLPQDLGDLQRDRDAHLAARRERYERALADDARRLRVV